MEKYEPLTDAELEEIRKEWERFGNLRDYDIPRLLATVEALKAELADIKERTIGLYTTPDHH